MSLTQVAHSTRTIVLRVPVNTPAVHSSTPAPTTVGHLTPQSLPSEEQIVSFQTFLNEVSIRLAEILHRQESQMQ